MNFTDKYITTDKETQIAQQIPNEDPLETPVEEPKLIISNDAYALGEMLQNLIDKIEHARCSLMK